MTTSTRRDGPLPAADRLTLLQAIRNNLRKFGDELAASDTAMKNGQMGESLYSNPMSKIATVVPMANTVSAAIEVCGHIVKGEMPEPISIIVPTAEHIE